MIARAVCRFNMEDEYKRLKADLADLVSEAWDGSREERKWQIGRLIEYLLGYR